MDKVNQVLVAILALFALVIASLKFVPPTFDHNCDCIPCQCDGDHCDEQCKEPQGDKRPSGSLRINRKLNEVKGGDCVVCPRIVNVPAATPGVRKPVSKLNEIKTGTWQCGECGSKKNGSEFHTFWSHAGEPVTPCCQACWDRMSNDQRKACVTKWARLAKASEASIQRWVSQVQ